MKIVHIVNRDKFSDGYINFMKLSMGGYGHTFIIRDNGHEKYPLPLTNNESVYYIRRYEYQYVAENRELIDALYAADRIIVSGVFKSKYLAVDFDDSLWAKTYLHFWGGDFYFLRDRESFEGEKGRISAACTMECVNRCKAVIMLLDGEYYAFKEIVGVEKTHYVAPVPGGECEDWTAYVYSKYRGERTGDGTVRILLGNSATKTNCHSEVLELLGKFKGQDIKVYCPLSYGDREYGNEVAKKGIEVLGNKFIPIFEYMQKEDFNRFLSTMDIGIFNNSRQQALYSIRVLLGLGKKVYLKMGTSMWDFFRGMGLKLHVVNEIEAAEFREFCHWDEAERLNNERCFDNYDGIEDAKKAWQNVFNLG